MHLGPVSRITVLALVAACIAPLTATPAGAADCAWTWQNPLPSGHTWTDVVSIGESLVAVGEHGTVATSSDAGASWTVTSITDANLHAVATDRERVVAVGGGGLVATWIRREGWRMVRVGSHDLWDITFADATWIAVGDAGTVLTSADATVWQATSSVTSQPLYAVTRSNDGLVAVGGGGVVATSPNGRQWSSATSGVAVPLFAVTESNNRLVAAGLLGTTVISDDAEQWFTVDVPTLSALRDLHHGADGRLYALSSNGVFVTDDGLFWQPEDTGVATPRGLLAATSTRSGMVAVGELGLVSRRDLTGSWRQLSHGSTAWWSGLASGAGQTVLVGKHPGGEGGVIGVADATGRSWQVTARLESGLNDVVWTGERFIAVGDGGSLWLSSNGTAWDPPEIGTTRAEPLTSIVWTGERAVAVGGGGTALTSEDGLRWTRHHTGAISSLHDVAWSDGRLVAVGDNGTIVTSTDGSSWTRERSGTPVPLFAVATDSDRFVAVGVTGVIVTSRDGSSWTEVVTGSEDILRSVVWDRDQFIAVGDWGTLLRSTDGLSWTTEQLPTRRTLQVVASADGDTLVGGWYGSVLRSSCQPARVRRIPTEPESMILP